ncbi:MAG: PH domain-containing protein [Bacilli bacterium]|nr:PH domain-containing protein [Bacilli bacterium]
MKNDLYERVNNFVKRYPFTIVFRLRKHVKVLEKHLNEGEEVFYIFPAQKNNSIFDIFATCVVALTNKRLLIAQKRVVPGYRLNSITPDLFNDFQVFKGLIFGKLNIDTVKEVVQLSNLDPKCLNEVETNLSEYLLKQKPKILNSYKKNK